MTRRALLISPGYTLLDDATIRQTPDNTWSQGLGVLLDRVAKTIDGAGVVLLDGPAARALRLPSSAGESTDEGIDTARALGWKVTEPAPWTTFYADGRPSIHLGVLPLLDPKRCPLIEPLWPQDTVCAMGVWHELAGTAWHGTPGVAGMALLRAHLPRIEVRGKTVPVAVKPKTTGPEQAQEKPWEGRNRFERPENPHAYSHGYDCSRMYLNAAGACEVLAPWTLKHTGKLDFNPKLAGWWQVELSPWTDDRMPHPAGPGDPLLRWITTPTAVLLEQLVAEGVYGGIRVVDSWTGNGKRLLRDWAGVIEGTYQRATELALEDTARGQHAERVAKAAKLVYKEAWGLLNRPTNAVYRPDWHYAILAQARANLWRRVWSVGKAADRWPVLIDVDNVWYESGSDDPVEACPKGITLGDRLGQFKPKGTRGKKP